MIRAANWFLDGLESVALTALVASRIARGFLLDEKPEKPATKRAREANGKGAWVP